MKKISTKYNQIKITLANHEQVLNLIKTEDETKCNLIVRNLLINGLTKNEDDLRDTNADKLYKKFPGLLFAILIFAASLGTHIHLNCYRHFYFTSVFLELLQNHRKLFTLADMRRVFTQMCAEKNAQNNKLKLLSYSKKN